MENVKVIIWGLGAMGGGMADMLLKKQGVDIVGVAGRNKKIGKSMYDYIKTPRGDRPDVLIGAPEDVIKPGAADVVLLCTDSFTKQAFPRIKFILEQGINVITSAEEMAYPKAQEPELTEELDRIAKANGVSVLGTGINPGLIMDLLVLIWTGCMEDVEHIVSRRVNSLSPFGPAVMEEQGIGISKEEFYLRKEGKGSGHLSGHVGFAESVGMIAEGIGWDLDDFKHVNDTYGHAAGDRLLAAIGGVLRDTFRTDDIVARVGGDEFVAFLSGSDNRVTAEQKGQELLERVRELKVDGVDRSITVSVGAAGAPAHGRTYEELSLAADQAMYQVKNNGKGGFLLI